MTIRQQINEFYKKYPHIRLIGLAGPDQLYYLLRNEETDEEARVYWPKGAVCWDDLDKDLLAAMQKLKGTK